MADPAARSGLTHLVPDLLSGHPHIRRDLLQPKLFHHDNRRRHLGRRVTKRSIQHPRMARLRRHPPRHVFGRTKGKHQRTGNQSILSLRPNAAKAQTQVPTSDFTKRPDGLFYCGAENGGFEALLIILRDASNVHFTTVGTR